jgi:Chaperone of endosialidase
MKNLRSVHAIVRVLLVIACFQMLVLAQALDDKNKGVTISGSGLSVKWDVAVPHTELTLTISAPDGQVFRREFKGRAAEFTLADLKGERFADGQYSYELRVTPPISPDVREALAAARVKGNHEEVRRGLIKRGTLQAQPLVVSGGFAILNGSIIVPGAFEEEGNSFARAMPPRVSRPSGSFRPDTATAMSGFRRHHPIVNPFFDFLVADDLIVQGSACVGLDCVDGENFGFDTIRLKENNTRLQFEDTSTSAGFASNNWQIRANAQPSGGANFLAFVDQGAGNSETGTIVFEVDAGAPANALRVSSTGNIGIGTGTPALDVHANTNDTPAIRLEQNNTGGFSAQTWDIAGNEANFFVRDITSGSTLPFRIRPGAPTSSIDISASGNVGIGTASPASLLHVEKNQATGTEIRVANSDTTGGFAGLYFNGGFGLTTGGLVQYNNITGEKNLFVTTGGADPLHLGTNNSIRMTILPNTGFVGINTTTPTDTLSVNGSASKSGGGSWSVFSDERLKNIKGSFTRGLQAAMRLQPLVYEYKANNALGLKSGEENVGFGAQQLQEIIPEAVTRNANGYLQVNNDPIIWTMLNAIKEQQQEILKLKEEIRQLRAASRKRK